MNKLDVRRRNTCYKLLCLGLVAALVLSTAPGLTAGVYAMPGRASFQVNQPPQISIALAPGAGPFRDPATVTITATVTDSDGTVTKVEFFEGNNKIWQDLKAPFTFSWSDIKTGNYNVTARVTDDQGATGKSNTINFSVFSGPVITLEGPADGQAFATSDDIILHATASDKDGAIDRVEFFKEGVAAPLGVATGSANYTFNWSGATPGAHRIHAVATDSDGNTATSKPANITVGQRPAVNIAVSGLDGAQLPFKETDGVQISVTAIPPGGGSIAKVELYEGEVSGHAPIAENGSNSLTYQLEEVGSCARVFKAVAVSNQGVRAEASVTVSGQPAGHARAGYINGIAVGQTKLFDQRSLALMLQSMQANLANRDFFDQASIAAAIGKIQGARFDASSLGVNVTTTALPSLSTVSTTGTPGVAQTITQPSTPAGEAPAAPGVTTVTTTPSNTIAETVNQASVAGTVPTPPSTQNTAFVFQPTFDQAPQTLLAKQVATNYEIANLRLLLEGALSDRLVDQEVRLDNTSVPYRAPRARGIAGFRISLDSPRPYKKAVAEVEVTIITQCRMAPAMRRAPSLVSLVPAESNYNVATVNKDFKQFGLGVAVQPISFGIASQKEKQQLYLIQDQDVIAFERARPALETDFDNSRSVTFGWQFRPVLGQEVVRAGTRQVYASLALPATQNEDYEASVVVRTYWRYYDTKKKTVGDMIPGSDSYQRLDNLVVNSDFVRGVPLQPKVETVNFQDAGQGNVLVWLQGSNFLPGTTVIVGNQVLDSAAKGLFIQGESDLRFIVPAQQLANSDQPLVIGQYGAPVPICNPKLGMTSRGGDSRCAAVGSIRQEPNFGLKIAGLTVVPVDARNSRVTLLVTSRNNGPLDETVSSRPVVLVGESAYGIGGTPLTKVGRGALLELSFVAPTQSIRNAGKVGVRSLFFGDEYSDEVPITDLAAFDMADDFTASEVKVLFSSETEAQLAITGSGFTPAVKVRAGAKDLSVATAANPAHPYLTRSDPTLLVLHVTAQELKALKHVVVNQGEAQPVILSVTTPPAAAPKPEVTALEAVTVNDEVDVKVTGVNLTSVDKVLFRGILLTFEAAPDGKSGKLRVTKDLSEKTGSKSIDFIAKDGTKVSGVLVVRSGA